MSEKKKNETKLTMSMGTLYDANKQLLATHEPLNEVEIAGQQSKIANWLNWEVDSYSMLYCRELSDITLIRMYGNPPCNENPPAVAANEIIQACLERGDILSIEQRPDKVWEIWVNYVYSNGDKEPHLYFLFNYDNAVIEC